MLKTFIKWSYIWDGGVESRDLEVGVGGWGAVSLHGYQPGRGHLVGILETGNRHFKLNY